MEGYVAFLPVAFVFLLLTLFVRHAATCSGGRTGVYPNPEKATYFNGAFLTIRDIVVFALITALEPLVHLHVACVSTSAAFRSGARSGPPGIRARMRNGFGDERRELHSTHSLQGKLAVFMVFVFGVRLVGAGVGSLDGSRRALPEHAVQLVVLHGRLAVRAHAVLDARARVERAPRHAPTG